MSVGRNRQQQFRCEKDVGDFQCLRLRSRTTLVLNQRDAKIGVYLLNFETGSLLPVVKSERCSASPRGTRLKQKFNRKGPRSGVWELYDIATESGTVVHESNRVLPGHPL